MIIQLDDNNKHLEFAPFTLTRPVGNLRVGILTNNKRWQKWIPDASISYNTEDYLQRKFPPNEHAVIVNSCVIPNQDVVDQVKKLKGNEELVYEGVWIAKLGTGDVIIELKGEAPTVINHRWEIYQKMGKY